MRSKRWMVLIWGCLVLLFAAAACGRTASQPVVSLPGETVEYTPFATIAPSTSELSDATPTPGVTPVGTSYPSSNTTPSTTISLTTKPNPTPTVTPSPTPEPDPIGEIKGVWAASVWNLDFPSKAGLSAASQKAELDEMVRTTASAGLNAIYFQVRPMSDALYRSSIFPASTWLTGNKSGVLTEGFDPLAYLIEIAHKQNIQVHAWINPYRVTNGTAAYPKTDYGDLAPTNPARLHPEWTIVYANACIVYNPGLPEVRQLICDGVAEIVRNYDVDGIVFDDYFYPYPIRSEPFHDEATYAQYGAGFESLADFRRDNVNQLVKACYQTVKFLDSDCLFGISPAGIWQNDDGTNGGSATNAPEPVYSLIYCDALAWAKGGYVDYIAPQIYWSFATEDSAYGVLCRWWGEKLAQYQVAFFVAHGAYRYEAWNTPGEMTRQILLAREQSTYGGSIFYRYYDIRNNLAGVTDELKRLYASDKNGKN